MDVVAPTLSYGVGQVLRGRTPEAFDIGPDGHVWFVLAVTTQAEAAPAPEAAEPGTGNPPWPQIFQIVEMAQGQVVLDVEMAVPTYDLSSVNPIGDQVLLSWARGDDRIDDRWEINGWVYSRDGRLQRELHLGDAIEDLQVSADGAIWASYFDEGLYGDTEGKAGLVAWSAHGTPMFRLTDIAALRPAGDILAMNVASDRDTWCIHCAAGSILCIRDHRVGGLWELGRPASRAMAVQGQDVLMAGPWEFPFSMNEILPLLKNFPPHGGATGSDTPPAAIAAMLESLGQGVLWGDERDEASTRELRLHWRRLLDGGGSSSQGSFALRTPEGESIAPDTVRGRGSRLFVLAGETLHEVEFADVMSSRADRSVLV